MYFLQYLRTARLLSHSLLCKITVVSNRVASVFEKLILLLVLVFEGLILVLVLVLERMVLVLVLVLEKLCTCPPLVFVGF